MPKGRNPQPPHFKKLTPIGLLAACIIGGGLLLTNEIQAEEVVLHTTSAENVCVVPLVPGDVPDFTQGKDWILDVPEGCEDDMKQPVKIVPLSKGEFVAVWWNWGAKKACYSHYALKNSSDLNLLYAGTWFTGEEWVEKAWIWEPPPPSTQLPSLDLNGDKIDDLVLTYYEYSGGQYKVALGKKDGSFDFSNPTITFINRSLTAANTVLADADNDGLLDLVYFVFASGGDESTDLYMLKGQGDGTFASSPGELLVSTGVGRGSGSQAFGDFKEDGNIDIFFAPDDDVYDSGQAYASFRTGPGIFAPPIPIIDFDPNNEGTTSDGFFLTDVTLFDVNLDGHLDIISREVKPDAWKVYFGDGQGNFSFTDKTLPVPISDGLVWMSIPCDVVSYVVHDGGLNDSLLLIVSNPKLQFTPIGTVHKGYDLEALALHPQTGELYASSGENTNKPGYLYQVQGENVVELGQPGAFAGGLEGLSFNPNTNILWGWAQGTGLVKFDRIEPNPTASVVLPYPGEIQDLTWNPQGDILYAVENIPQGGKNKVILWAYHPAEGSVVAQCEKELEGWQEVEALQALPNGNLLFGLHNSKKLLTGTIDPNHGCQLGEIKEIPVPYDDIEGIALTACPLTM